jgi:hypothetical protein
MSKYLAKKTRADGILFDSKKEAQRYQQLKLMQKAGMICDLKCQVKYELVPAQYIDGKCVERAVTYTSDFEYYVLKDLRQKTVMADKDAKQIGQHIVEDVKGYRTEVYKIKKKLMLYKYGIRITEV